MDSATPDSDAMPTPATGYPVPAWLRPGASGLVDPQFAAGAALSALDRVMRDAPFWAGVWQQRLRLQAAAGACRFLGRPETEQGLRDLWLLRTEGGAVGPAGAVLNAYQDLGRDEALRAETVERVAVALGLPQRRGVDVVMGVARAVAGDAAPLPAAAMAARLVAGELGDGRAAELMGFWIGDALLAKKLGWARAVPLLSAELTKQGGAARRPRSGDSDWQAMAAAGVAVAAVRAVDLANELARRAVKLQAAAAEVRTKNAAAVVARLLTQDAVTTRHVRGMISDRAARRLFERLRMLGGVRELSGRPLFRIYGL
jgi:hypothetical protein